MRLLLLPISTKQSLIYWGRLNRQLTQETTRLDRLTTRASATWLSWEKGNWAWQKWITKTGNQLFQRLPYEEWGLKSIPPYSILVKNENLRGKEEVRLEYPEAFIERERVKNTLQMYGSQEKQSFHTKWMLGSLIGMPLTAPVALLPIIPNIPFFYLCFRAWSHWRARNGSSHLELLIKKNLVRYSPSSILRTVYTDISLDRTIQELSLEVAKIGDQHHDFHTSKVNNESMLLSKMDGKQIAECLKVPELALEIERAVWQVEKSLKTREEPKEMKAEIGEPTKAPRPGQQQRETL